ncbi:hypothetical protein LUZ61_007175 [Rhynchospora tenuis]|uniref:SWIM-type domain-containing protein n=1 Tax=Rhynchospora tenuis TaxID=198213 RepID=A0AAD5ZSZ9_9POAL|nr:hypothetical protein LUZ61_007175 [Rhynchospora tenuis]
MNYEYNNSGNDWSPWEQPEGSSRQQEGGEEEIEQGGVEEEEGDIEQLDEAYDRGPGNESAYATGEDFTDEEVEFLESQGLDEQHMVLNRGQRFGEFTHDNLTATVIANCIRNAVKRDLGISIEDVKSMLELKYPNVKPTYNKLWRGREKAIEQLFGSWEGAYNKLPSLLLAIQGTTPGTVIKWLAPTCGNPNRAMFLAAAWAFGPCIAAVPYLRPVISIDASFLSGRYRRKLLAAVGYDPEQRLVPLAFALVRTEDEACWGWFMKFLRDYDDREPAKPERWAQTYDGGPRWGLMTSNGSESLNSRYKAERRLPVVGLVEGTWYKTVSWFNERKLLSFERNAEGERWPKTIQEKISKRTLKAVGINVVTIDQMRGEFEAQVPYEKSEPGVTWKYKVLIRRAYQPTDPQLPTRRAVCQCRKPQLTGIPCVHVIAFCSKYRWEVDDFVDDKYSTENMLKIWSSGEFHCYGDEENWPVYDGPLIYPDRRMINRGRRKKDRDWMWMDAMRKNKNKRNRGKEPLTTMEDVQSGRRTTSQRTTRTSTRNRAQSSARERGETSRTGANTSNDPVQPSRNSISTDPRTESHLGLGIEGLQPRRNSISLDPRSVSTRYPSQQASSRGGRGPTESASSAGGRGIRTGFAKLGARIRNNMPRWGR